MKKEINKWAIPRSTTIYKFRNMQVSIGVSIYLHKKPPDGILYVEKLLKLNFNDFVEREPSTICKNGSWFSVYL